MENFTSIDQLKSLMRGHIPYAEFVRVPTMSCGVYVLRAGEEDLQRPHSEDEIYYVVRGAARMHLNARSRPVQDRAVGAGDVIFVAAHEEHRFHDITEELVLLVIFAPAVTIPERPT